MSKKLLCWFICLLSIIGLLFIPRSAKSENVVEDVANRFEERSKAAKIAAAKADVGDNIATALKLYELDNKLLPTTEQGLLSLLEKPTIDPIPANWQGPYLIEMPKDPWGNNYKYDCPGVHNKDSYDLSSFGPDVVESEDDITNWN